MLSTLKENNPEDNIIGVEVFFINNVLHVNRKFLEKYMPTTDQTMRNWEKVGLRVSPYSFGRTKIYDLIYVLKWHKSNIDQEQSAKANRREGEGIPLDDEDQVLVQINKYGNLPLNQVPSVEADRRKSIAHVRKLLWQNDELEGKLISIEDIDKNMDTQARIHKTHMSMGEKNLPMLLSGKPIDEMEEIIHKYNQAQLDQLHSLMQKEYDSDETLSDIIDVALDLLSDGKNPKKIIKKMRK